MDWFEQITGFKELDYETTQSRLSVVDGRLCSTHTDRRPVVGAFEIPSLAELRQRTQGMSLVGGVTSVSAFSAEARQLHSDPRYHGAMFQVASQFNLLEMVGPTVTPEHGVTRYINDPTQGPACAIAAGAATIFRNYLVDVEGGIGQRETRQIDCLADLGKELAASLGRPLDALWAMRNGYALCSREGVAAIDAYLAGCSLERLDVLRGLLRIGIQTNTEITDAAAQMGQCVSQAFCSALPVAYSRLPGAPWERFATLVLEACYEATIRAAALNAQIGGCQEVLLTQVGGGAFGNETPWIHAAIKRSLPLARDLGLATQIICYGSVPKDVRELISS